MKCLLRARCCLVFVALVVMASSIRGADYFDEDFSGTTRPATLEDAPGSEFGLPPVYGGTADWSANPADSGGGNHSSVRTVASDYNTTSFRAEITVIQEVTNGDEGVSRNGVFGFGTGQRQDDSHVNPGAPNGSQFGLPTAGPVIYMETTTLFNSGYLVRGWEKEPDVGGSFGDITGLAFMVDEVTGERVSMTDGGTHRIRMDYDAVAQTLQYSVDVDYTGGPMVVDTILDPFAANAIDPGVDGTLDVSPSALQNYVDTENFGDLRDTDELGDPVEFKNTNSHIFFGGENVQFDDLSIVLTGPLPGDFDTDSDVDGNDFLEWQRGFPGTFDADDLTDWEANYGAGVGPLVGAVTVPEPSTSWLVLISALALVRVRKR